MTETMPIINIRRNYPINYKIENIDFSNENKKKIINLLKKNESNVFTNENVNNLIKLVSNENKIKIKNLLNKANKLKYNNLSENNKKIIDELLKIKKIFENFKSRGFYDNNQNNTRESILSNNNRVNISKIIRMVDAVHKYVNVLDPNIVDIFKPVFDELFRQNIKPTDTKPRKLFFNKDIFELNPEIYDSKINGNIKINSIKNLGKGAFSTVYTNISVIKNKNIKKLNSTILKIIDDKSREKIEFKSLIFNICLLALLYFQNSNGIKYFCDLYEFGKVKRVNNSFYAIMENGGGELSNFKINDYRYKTEDIPYGTILDRLNILLHIIKECSKAIQVLHNIDMVHCDIKLENFLYLIKDGYYDIKIIDFGFIKKNGAIANGLFGTPNYITYDFYNSIYGNGNKKYKITIKNDIYALGIIFLYLLYIILNYGDYSTISQNYGGFAIVTQNMYTRLKSGQYQGYATEFVSLIKKNLERNIIFIFNTLTTIFESLKDTIFMRKEIIQKKKDFIQKLNTILRKITYLEGNYNNLQEFIDDIDNLIRLLNEIK